MLLQRAHRQQQAVLRRCQEKVAKTKSLEETVRQQEKVSWGHKVGVRRVGRGAQGSSEKMGPSGLFHPSMSTTQCQDHGGWGDVMVTTASHRAGDVGLCSLRQVIEAMERVLREKLAGAGRSTEKPAGGCKQGQGPSGGGGHRYTAAGFCWWPSPSDGLHHGVACGGRSEEVLSPLLAIPGHGGGGSLVLALISAQRGGCSTHPSAPPSSHPTGEALSGEVYAVLLAENRRLRDDLARPPYLLPPVIPQPPALPVRPGRGTQGW